MTFVHPLKLSPCINGSVISVREKLWWHLFDRLVYLGNALELFYEPWNQSEASIPAFW